MTLRLGSNGLHHIMVHEKKPKRFWLTQFYWEDADWKLNYSTIWQHHSRFFSNLGKKKTTNKQTQKN